MLEDWGIWGTVLGQEKSSIIETKSPSAQPSVAMVRNAGAWIPTMCEGQSLLILALGGSPKTRGSRGID